LTISYCKHGSSPCWRCLWLWNWSEHYICKERGSRADNTAITSHYIGGGVYAYCTYIDSGLSSLRFLYWSSPAEPYKLQRLPTVQLVSTRHKLPHLAYQWTLFLPRHSLTHTITQRFVAITVLIFIRNVLCSNVDQDTAFSSFSSVPSDKYRDNKLPRLLVYKSSHIQSITDI
jgi:hypothetical protein